jgi:hypothetical protein
MSDEVHELFEAYLAMQRNRGFGDLALRADAAVSPFSRAKMAAARNLLTKAHKALHDGDRDRAVRYVDRAVVLPYDEVEEASPAAWEAHMALFMAVTDELGYADHDDQAWLDAALATLDSATEAGRYELRRCLATIGHDYELSGRQRKRLLAAIAGIPARPELYELELSPEELATAVLEILETVIAYEAALD